MNPEQIKELIEVTKAISYLNGFIEGKGFNKTKKSYPFGAKNMKELKTYLNKLSKHHDKLILKFKDGNTTANK
tara:strand:- start:111 stop:329 length:219 start_codon:yes stop_codon:yes gene_type:complete